MTDKSAPDHDMPSLPGGQVTAEAGIDDNPARAIEHCERVRRLVQKARREGKAGLVTDGEVYVIVEI
jgi:hypothetical protein